MEKRKVVATWTGSCPCLCHGEWMLEVDGKDYTEAIPKDYRTESMGTYGTYERWDFDKNDHVEWDTQNLRHPISKLATGSTSITTRRHVRRSRQRARCF